MCPTESGNSNQTLPKLNVYQIIIKMIETEETSKGQIKTSDDSFNDRVDTLIEDLIKTNIEENVENTCKTCHKTIKDDIDNNNILGT